MQSPQHRGGSAYVGAELGSLEAEERAGGYFARKKHFLVYSCIFPECAAPTHLQGTGISRNLDPYHLSHW